MHVLFLLSPHLWVPVQSERWSGAALHLSVSREGAGGGSNGSPVARHNEVGAQRTHKSFNLNHKLQSVLIIVLFCLFPSTYNLFI